MPESPAHEVALRIFGMPLTLACAGSAGTELAAAVRDRWAWCAPPPDRADPPDPDARLDARLDAGPHGRADPAEMTGELDRIATAITLTALDRADPSWLMIHAAGLTDPATGAAVVLAGASGTGKSTLARALGRDFGYLSDETIAVDAAYGVHGCPRPVLLAPAPGRPKTSTSPDALGLRRPGAAPWLAAIVLLERDPGHLGPPAVRRLDRPADLLALGPQISHLPRVPAAVRRLAATLDAVGGLRHVRYAECDDLAALLTDLLAAARPPSATQPSAPTAPTAPADPVPPGALDWLIVADEAVALTETADPELVWLGPLATEILRHAATDPSPPTTPAQWEIHLRGRFGAPAPGTDPQVAIDTTLAELTRLGLWGRGR